MHKDHLILSFTVWKRFISRPLQLTVSERWMVIGLVPLLSAELSLHFICWMTAPLNPPSVGRDECQFFSRLWRGKRSWMRERETERSQWSSFSSASRADVSSDGGFARSQLWAENILSAPSENTQPVDITSRGALNAHWYVHLRNTFLEGIEKAGLWKSFPVTVCQFRCYYVPDTSFPLGAKILFFPKAFFSELIWILWWPSGCLVHELMLKVFAYKHFLSC